MLAEPGLRLMLAEPGLRVMLAEPGLRAMLAEPGLRAMLAEPSLRAMLAEPSLRAMLAEPCLVPLHVQHSGVALTRPWLRNLHHPTTRTPGYGTRRQAPCGPGDSTLMPRLSCVG